MAASRAARRAEWDVWSAALRDDFVMGRLPGGPGARGPDRGLEGLRSFGRHDVAGYRLAAIDQRALDLDHAQAGARRIAALVAAVGLGALPGLGGVVDGQDP